jgi:hypothetical protein
MWRVLDEYMSKSHTNHAVLGEVATYDWASTLCEKFPESRHFLSLRRVLSS